MKRKSKKTMSNKTKVVIAALIAVAILVTGSAIWISRPKSAGIYNSLGFRMDADDILSLTVAVSDKVRSYTVSFDEYRTVFLHFATNVPEFIEKEEGVYTKVSDATRNTAVKEQTEDTLKSYYCIVALADDLGIGLTDDDRAKYAEEYDMQVERYAGQISDDYDFDGTKAEYAKYLYEQSVQKNLGMSMDYFEFNYYNSLLIRRVKDHIGTDVEEITNESYMHYKQVMVEYTKGDSSEEAEALAKIGEAYDRLSAGDDIDDLIAEYGNSSYDSEYYIDAYGAVVGSETKHSVDSTVLEMCTALGYGEFSEIMSGESESGRGFYAIMQREKITAEYVCGSSTEAGVMYMYPYVGAPSYTSYYTKYQTLIDGVYEQNMMVVPIDEKVYRRIAINTLF